MSPVGSPIRNITLTTDFGLRDHYVGVMKGVIAAIHPAARVIDISHGIPAHDIPEGAFTIAQAWSHFPTQTIHVVVVDPGVGSDRRPIAAQCEDHIFIAPDNGVLSQVFEAAPPHEIRSIDEDLGLDHVSRTFHGRDLFAPVAARLSAGMEYQDIGRPVQNPVILPSTKPVGGLGRVLHVDRFGNIVTSLRKEHLAAAIAISVGRLVVSQTRETYAGARDHEPFLVAGSSGYLEVSVNRDSAAALAGVRAGDPVSTTERPATAPASAAGDPPSCS